jgi:transposase
MARKTYTREFKLQAMRLLTEKGLSVAEAARQLGVGENCLRCWRAAFLAQGDAASQGPPKKGGGAGYEHRHGRDLLSSSSSYESRPLLCAVLFFALANAGYNASAACYNRQALAGG